MVFLATNDARSPLSRAERAVALATFASILLAAPVLAQMAVRHIGLLDALASPSFDANDASMRRLLIALAPFATRALVAQPPSTHVSPPTSSTVDQANSNAERETISARLTSLCNNALSSLSSLLERHTVNTAAAATTTTNDDDNDGGLCDWLIFFIELHRHAEPSSMSIFVRVYDAIVRWLQRSKLHYLTYTTCVLTLRYYFRLRCCCVGLVVVLRNRVHCLHFDFFRRCLQQWLQQQSKQSVLISRLQFD
jgi:hypothetical protein